MKKFTAILLVLILLCSTVFIFTGCGKDREKVIGEFEEIIAKDPGLDEEAVEARLSELKEYLQSNLKYVDSEDADYMVFNYIEEVYRAGNDVNYSDISKMFKKHLSDLFVSLLEIEIIDQEQPITNDEEGGKLNCDFDEIAGRALKIESLITEYRDELNSDAYSYMKEHVLWHFKYYMNILLIGTSSNPLFSYETGEFDENAEAMYTSVAQENPDTVTAWALNEFFTYLDSMGYSLNYKNAGESKIYYDTCAYIVNEAGKRVFQ